MRAYNVDVKLERQEDGLWRATVPGLQGCWVDAPTMEQAIGDIQEAVAMFIDFLEEKGEGLPSSVQSTDEMTFTAKIPVNVGAYQFSRPARRSKKPLAE